MSETLERPNSWLNGNKSPFTALQHLVPPAEAQSCKLFPGIKPFPEAINSGCHINSHGVSSRIFTAAWLRLGMEGPGIHWSDRRHLLLSSSSQESLFAMLAVKILYKKTRGAVLAKVGLLMQEKLVLVQHTGFTPACHLAQWIKDVRISAWYPNSDIPNRREVPLTLPLTFSLSSTVRRGDHWKF